MGDCIWGFLNKYALYIALVCLPLYAVFWFLDIVGVLIAIHGLLPAACLVLLSNDMTRRVVNYIKAIVCMIVCTALLLTTLFYTNAVDLLGDMGDAFVGILALNIGLYLYYLYDITMQKTIKIRQKKLIVDDASKGLGNTTDDK